MSGWDSKGSTRGWRRTRAAVLSRDHWTCQLQLPGCTHHADQVHHVAGKANGDDPSQLLAACSSCNLQIGDPFARSPRPRPVTNWDKP